MLPVPVKPKNDDESRGLMNDDVGSSPVSRPTDHDSIPINSTSSTSTNNNNNLNGGYPTSSSHSTPIKNRVSKRDVNKRIASYLKESDENCKESATLVAIVVIGLIVTGSVIGFLQLGHHDPSVIHKGSHASLTHVDGEALPTNLNEWFKDKNIAIDEEIDDGDLDSLQTLGLQPLYRNYLVQTIYEYSYQSAIRINKWDPIFQHISMTYGGPWIVPQIPDDEINDDIEYHGTRRRRRLLDDDDNTDNDDDTETDTEEDVIDSESDIFMASMENGRNEYEFNFGASSPEDSSSTSSSIDGEYESNVNEWHCIIFEFGNADLLVPQELKQEEGEIWKSYKFRISTEFTDFDMESGYDFVRIYVNSEYSGNSLTGTFSSRTFTYFVDFDYLNEWNEFDIPSFELCYNIITDSSVNRAGFNSITKIEYENPQYVEWENSACHIESPSWRNPDRWDGSCGVGVHTSTITKCNEPADPVQAFMKSNKNSFMNGIKSPFGKDGLKSFKKGGAGLSPDIINKFMNIHHQAPREIAQMKVLTNGVCDVDEVDHRYCIVKDCGDAPVDSSMNPQEFRKNPKIKYHFNGIGRIDPSYPSPFRCERSHNREINISDLMSRIALMRDNIASEYDELRVLTESVTQHEHLDDSKLRLGIKLVRSLLLGDTFHAVFTGSSNTAGHDNLFVSSYPMQLQSILRPLWKDIGFQGAAFKVSNRAVGGAIGTDQLAWCIPEISGGNADKIDVIFWESLMNDAGSELSRSHTMEDHIRNSLSLNGGTYNQNSPNRPIWHSVIAGSNGDTPSKFGTASAVYSGYKDLIDLYSEYGAGIVEFKPSLGMNPMKTISDSNEWSDEEFYVTWHPGPRGHRIYAEIIAYYYLDAAYSVLSDIYPTILDLEQTLNTTIVRPVLEMLDLLQDPPYLDNLPEPSSVHLKCDPLCTDASHSYCILGFNPKDSIYDITNYIVDPSKWLFKSVAGNPQPIDAMAGGQASIDTKYCYVGNKHTGKLILSVKIEENNYLLVEKPYADWGGLNDILKKMDQWFNVEIIDILDNDNNDQQRDKKGTILKCEKPPKHPGQAKKRGKDVWAEDIQEFGCLLKFKYSGKYEIAISVDTEEDIPICVIASI